MDILSSFIQAGAVITGAGRFAVQKSVNVSRLFLASSLGLVMTDYFLTYASTGQSVKMVGALTIGTMFCRSLFLMTKRGQEKAKPVASSAFLIGSTLAVASQVATGSLSPSIALSLGGLGFGCLADYQKTMRNRRACFFAMGIFSMGFALASGSWPLFINNLSTDVIANSYFIHKYDLMPYYQGTTLQKMKKYFVDILSGRTLPTTAKSRTEKATVPKTKRLDMT